MRYMLVFACIYVTFDTSFQSEDKNHQKVGKKFTRYVFFDTSFQLEEKKAPKGGKKFTRFFSMPEYSNFFSRGSVFISLKATCRLLILTF